MEPRRRRGAGGQGQLDGVERRAGLGQGHAPQRPVGFDAEARARGLAAVGPGGLGAAQPGPRAEPHAVAVDVGACR